MYNSYTTFFVFILTKYFDIYIDKLSFGPGLVLAIRVQQQ